MSKKKGKRSEFRLLAKINESESLSSIIEATSLNGAKRIATEMYPQISGKWQKSKGYHVKRDKHSRYISLRRIKVNL